MKRISLLIGALLIAAPLFAQVQQGIGPGGQVRKLELTASLYSYNQLDGVDFHGAGGGIAVHLSKGFAIAGDFSLNKAFDDANQELFSFRGGPRFTLRNGKASIFGQILVGGAHYRTDFDTTRHAWAGGAGGGVDIAIKDWISYRAIQAEYFPAYFKDVGLVFHGAKLSTGFVFHLH